MSRWWFPNSAEGSFVSEWRVSKTWCVYCKMLYLLPNLTLESYFNQVQRMQHKSWRNSSRHASDKMLVANKPSDWRRFWSCWTVWNCLLLAHVVINWMCTFHLIITCKKTNVLSYYHNRNYFISFVRHVEESVYQVPTAYIDRWKLVLDSAQLGSIMRALPLMTRMTISA